MVIDQWKIWYPRESRNRIIQKSWAFSQILWGSIHQSPSHLRCSLYTSLYNCRLPTSNVNERKVRQDNESSWKYWEGRLDKLNRWYKQIIQGVWGAPQDLRVPYGHHRRHHLLRVQDSYPDQSQWELRRLLSVPSRCLPSLETERPTLFVTNNSYHPSQSDLTGRNKRRKPYLPAVCSQGQDSAELP